MKSWTNVQTQWWAEAYPCTSSISWGCNSSSLRTSILLEIDWTVCIETFIRVCKLLNAARVLSTEVGSSPFSSWLRKCAILFSYSSLNRSPAYKWQMQAWLPLITYIDLLVQVCDSDNDHTFTSLYNFFSHVYSLSRVDWWLPDIVLQDSSE
jgi:hypothetical protein